MNRSLAHRVESLSGKPAAPVPLGDATGTASGAAARLSAHGWWDGTSLYRVIREGRETTVERLSSREGEARLGGAVERDTDGTYRERVAADRLEPGRLWEVWPHTRPVAFGSAAARTFGTGDRLGLAGHAHAAEMRERDVRPVLAQQSVRELTQTRRTYADISRAAALGAIEAGFDRGFGFDGDHLKTVDEVRAAHDAGCSMLTLDLSGSLDMIGVRGSEAEVDSAWKRLPVAVRDHWSSSYGGRHVTAGGINLHLDDDAVRRTAVTFAGGLGFVQDVADLLRDRGGRAIDLEVSVDETGVDTTAQQHFMIAAELERRGIPVTSLAPKFVGEFQKGVDYIGDPAELAQDLQLHADLARGMNSGYRLSLHSGSDKFTLFPLVEPACRGRYHVKTSGTFWLEALRAVALACPETFEMVFAIAWDRLDEMRSLYDLHAERSRIAQPAEKGRSAYGTYFDESDARQLLHVSYGAVLRDDAARSAFLDCLAAERGRYLELVGSHLRRHLDALGVPRV